MNLKKITSNEFTIATSGTTNPFDCIVENSNIRNISDEIYRRAAKDVGVLICTAEEEYKRWKLVSEDVLRDLYTWRANFRWTEPEEGKWQWQQLIHPNYDYDPLHYVPYQASKMVDELWVEHNYKFHYIITVSAKKTLKEGVKLIEKSYNPREFKQLCLDLVWNACLATFLSVNMSARPLFFADDAIKNSVKELFRLANINSCVNYETVGAQFGEAVQFFYNWCYNQTSGDKTKVNRVWLANIAESLNGYAGYDRYDPEANYRGCCNVKMRSGLLRNLTDNEEFLKLPTRTKQIEFIRKECAKYPEFKGTAPSWLVKALEEIVIDDEIAIKPWAPGERAGIARDCLAQKIEAGLVDKHKKHEKSEKQKAKEWAKLIEIVGKDKPNAADQVWLSSHKLSYRKLY